MSKLFFYDGEYPREQVYRPIPRVKRYGLLNFVWDLFMTGVTGGLWLIWVFCREMRRPRYWR
jgi:hypothetical protein